MNTKDLTLSQTEIHKLLSAGSRDAALLHLYLQCGNAPREAEAALGMSQARYSCAAATLRQLGLWPEESVYLRPPSSPPVHRGGRDPGHEPQRGISPPGGGGTADPGGGFSPPRS